jgi:hypothetical protein
MIDFDEIQQKVYELGLKGGVPLKYLKIFNCSLQDGTPHIEITDEAYNYVVEERGFELSRLKTSDVNELLFWILDNASSRYAFDYELENRVPNQDSRRIAFNLKIQIMKKINPEWGIRTVEYINETLKKSPYMDS